MPKTLTAFCLIFFQLIAHSQNQHKIDSLEAVLKIQQADTNKVNTLNQLAKATYSSNPSKAIEYANNGLLLSKSLKYNVGISNALNCLGVSNYNKGDFKTALVYYNEELKVVTAINDSMGIARVYDNTSNIYSDLRNSDSALLLRRASQKIYLSQNKQLNLAYDNMEIGSIYKTLANYSLAIENYLDALKIFEKLDDSINIARCLVNMSGVYRFTKQMELAKKYALEALKIDSTLGDTREEGFALYKLALISLDENKNDTGLTYLLMAEKKYKAVEAKYNLIHVYQQIGEVYRMKNDYPNALIYCSKSLIMAQEVNDKALIGTSFFDIANVYMQQNNFTKALEYAKKAQTFLKEINDKESLKELAGNFIEIFSRLNKPDSVEHYLNYYKQLSDTLYNQQNSKNIADMATKYQTEKKQDSITLQSKALALNKAEIKSRKLQLYILLPFSVLILFAVVIIFLFFKKANHDKQLIQRLKLGVHHDVKNQYQEILAFLKIAKNHNNEFSLDDASARISSMAKVHELLYNSQVYADLSLQSYLESLCKEIKNTFGRPGIDINISALVTLPTNIANKIGLIVNELLVNIFKYAFEPSQKGIVEVTLKKIDKNYLLRVADNGKGIAENKNNVKGFGTTLIKGWADELDGTYEIKNNNGTQFEMTF